MASSDDSRVGSRTDARDSVFSGAVGSLSGYCYGAAVLRESLTSEAVPAASRLSDQSLVLSVARGDREAMGELYDRYASLLLAVATRILGNRMQAEDLLHDALLEAWHRAGEYDPGRGSVRAWLVTRVRSRALDERIGSARRAEIARTRVYVEGDLCRPPPDQSDDDRVRRGVASLPPELEAVIDLAYFEGLTATEISLRLGIPSGTVKSRLARALETLRRALLPESGGFA